MFTDSHAHLASETYEQGVEEILVRAREAGVARMVCVGCDVESSGRGLELAGKHGFVRASVGLHPTYVTEEPAADWLAQLRGMAARPECVAIGETGLDFYHPAPEGWTWERYVALQKECFAAQLALAAELGKNVIVHQRDRSGTACWESIKEMMEPWHGKVRAVFHCWLHGWEEARPMVEKGHLISFTGIATYKNAPVVTACAAEAPAGSFMLETDSPYLSPVPHRGKRNEPAFLKHTAESIAAARGISLADLSAMTEGVADGFFAWTRSPEPA